MSSDDELDLKEIYDTTKTYATKFFKWKYAYEVLLVPIIYLSWWIRTRNLPLLEKTFLIGLDPYYYFRLAQEVLVTGSYSLFDTMRVFPFGKQTLFNFFPYFLAYWNKFLNIFGDFSLEYSNILYNPAATALSLVFLFLFLKNVFDKRVAIIAALLLIVSPAYLFRTIAGFADHEALFMLLMFLGLWLFSETILRKKAATKILFGISAGFVTFLAAITMTAIPLFTLPVAAFIIMAILWGNKNKKNFAAYSAWILAYAIPLLIFRGTGSIRDISILIPVFALLSLGTYHLIDNKYKFRVPVGLASLSIVGLFGLIGLLVFRIIDLGHLWETILSPAETTGRVADTISEIIGGTAIFNTFGWAVVLAIIGASIVAYKSFEDEHKIVKLYMGLGSFGLLGTILLLGTSTFMNFFMLISYGGLILGTYLFHKKFTPSDNRIIMLPFLMMLVTAYLTTTATRFLFFFAPLVAIFAAYFVITIIDYEGPRKNQSALVVFVLGLSIYILSGEIGPKSVKALIVLAYVALGAAYFVKKIGLSYKVVVSIALIFLIAVFAYQDYSVTSRQARGTGSNLPGAWLSAFNWVEGNTPEDAAIAHWWDYGYWTQSIGNRASIADGGTHNEYMLYLLGRYGMTGQTREEALSYYKTHNISYLLFSREEIGKYWAFSHIGSNKDLDRESTIGTFGLAEVREVRNGNRNIFRGNWRLDRDIVIDGKVYSRSSGIISEFSYPDDLSSGTLTFNGAGTTIEQPLKCLVINGQKIEFDVETYFGGCVVLLPLFDNNGVPSPNRAALYLSEKVRDGLFGRLYIQNEKIQGFEEVYSDGTPLGIFRNQVVGPVKIWKISYTNDIEPNPLWRSISREYEEGFR